MPSPYSPGELNWYHLIDPEVLTRFVINLPRQVSDELKWSHFIDRELFTRLVIDIRRDIRQVMKVIALWIWLEKIGYPNIIVELIQQPNPVVNAVMVEAMNCIYYIEVAKFPPPPPNINHIPLTNALMKQDISLQFFHGNRYTAMLGITEVMNDVCAKVFGDIVQQVLVEPGPSGEGSSKVVGGDGHGASDSDSESSPDEKSKGGVQVEISDGSTNDEESPPQTMGNVGGNANVEGGNSESSRDEKSPSQIMGINIGGSANVVSISHGFQPWVIRSQQKNSESSTDEESSDGSDTM